MEEEVVTMCCMHYLGCLWGFDLYYASNLHGKNIGESSNGQNSPSKGKKGFNGPVLLDSGA